MIGWKAIVNFGSQGHWVKWWRNLYVGTLKKGILEWIKVAAIKVFFLPLPSPNFFMFILIISNHTVYLDQFGINLHLWVFKKLKSALVEAARAISAFCKTYSCKFIPNWSWDRIKHTRGKRGGACNRLTNSIQVLGSRRRQIDIPFANSNRNQVSVNHWNLLNVQIDTLFSSSIRYLNAANTSSPGRPHFVPSILLSNAMSLAPKIDEIAYTLNSTNTDIAFFSETWLKETVLDDPIKIKGYQLFRRDRKNRVVFVCQKLHPVQDTARSSQWQSRSTMGRI